MKQKQEAGFTLIEIMLVVLILGIVSIGALVVAPGVNRAIHTDSYAYILKAKIDQYKGYALDNLEIVNIQFTDTTATFTSTGMPTDYITLDSGCNLVVPPGYATIQINVDGTINTPITLDIKVKSESSEKTLIISKYNTSIQ